MTGDVVNLRQARKARARRDKEKTAAGNRILFGRTKAEKELARKSSEKSAAHVEAHRLVRRDDGDDTGPGGSS